MKCRYCLTEVPDTEKYCPTCNIPLPMRHEASVRCPFCGEELKEPTNMTCPLCKREFSRDKYPSQRRTSMQDEFLKRRKLVIEESWIREGVKKQEFLESAGINPEEPLDHLYDIAENTLRNALMQKDYVKGEYVGTVMIELGKALRDTHRVIDALFHVVDIHLQEGKYSEALRVIKEVRNELKGQDLSPAIIHQLLFTEGQAQLLLGNYGVAKQIFLEAIRISRDHKAWEASIIVLGNLAITIRNLDEPEPFVQELETFQQNMEEWVSEETNALFLLAISYFIRNNKRLHEEDKELLDSMLSNTQLQELQYSVIRGMEQNVLWILEYMLSERITHEALIRALLEAQPSFTLLTEYGELLLSVLALHSKYAWKEESSCVIMIKKRMQDLLTEIGGKEREMIKEAILTSLNDETYETVTREFPWLVQEHK